MVFRAPNPLKCPAGLPGVTHFSGTVATDVVISDFEDAQRLTRLVLMACVIVGSIGSLVVSYRVGTQSLVLGSDEGRWTYLYLQGFQPHFIRAFVRVCLAAILFLAMPLGIARRHEWPAVFASLLIGILVQGQLRSETRYTFEQIFGSDGANAFYSPTLRYNAATALTDFDRVRPTLPTHAQANMPGKLMLVYALELVSRRPAVLAWLVVLLSNVGGVLMYLFVRDLFGDRIVAYISLILYLVVPAKLFFFPVLNTVTPVLILACACLWLWSLQTGRVTHAAFFGVALFAQTFFDPLALVMGLLFAAIAILLLRRSDHGWSRLLNQGGIAGIGFMATYAVLLIGFRFDLLTTLRHVATDAASFNVAAHRPYTIWIRQNLLDFLFGIGVCQAWLFFVAIGWMLHRAVTGQSDQPFTMLCLGLASTLLATDVIGINRGEVIRLWIFMACFFQIPAAYLCAKLNSRISVMLILGTTLAQDLLGTAMFNFAQP